MSRLVDGMLYYGRHSRKLVVVYKNITLMTFVCIIVIFDWAIKISGTRMWDVIAEVFKKPKVAKQGYVRNNEFREPCIELLKGRDGWAEHVDNGIRFIAPSSPFFQIPNRCIA